MSTSYLQPQPETFLLRDASTTADFLHGNDKIFLSQPNNAKCFLTPTSTKTTPRLSERVFLRETSVSNLRPAPTSFLSSTCPSSSSHLVLRPFDFFDGFLEGDGTDSVVTSPQSAFVSQKSTPHSVLAPEPIPHFTPQVAAPIVPQAAVPRHIPQTVPQPVRKQPFTLAKMQKAAATSKQLKNIGIVDSASVAKRKMVQDLVSMGFARPESDDAVNNVRGQLTLAKAIEYILSDRATRGQSASDSESEPESEAEVQKEVYDARLPHGWDMRVLPSGRRFFTDHNTKKTQWFDPRPLPRGWRMQRDANKKEYYVSDLLKKTQWNDPRPPVVPGNRPT